MALPAGFKSVGCSRSDSNVSRSLDDQAQWNSWGVHRRVAHPASVVTGKQSRAGHHQRVSPRGRCQGSDPAMGAGVARLSARNGPIWPVVTLSLAPDVAAGSRTDGGASSTSRRAALVTRARVSLTVFWPAALGLAPDAGLTRSYWYPVNASTEPIFEERITAIDLAFIDERNRPTRNYRVRWEGVWFSPRAERVDFHAGADDGVILRVDGDTRGGPRNSDSRLRCIPEPWGGTGMTTKRRRRFTAAFKKRVVLEALRGDRTVQEIAARHEVHPNQVSTWKRQAVDWTRSSPVAERPASRNTRRRSGTCTRRSAS